MGFIVAIVGFFGFGVTAAFTWDWQWLILCPGSILLGAGIDHAKKGKGE